MGGLPQRLQSSSSRPTTQSAGDPSARCLGHKPYMRADTQRLCHLALQGFEWPSLFNTDGYNSGHDSIFKKATQEVARRAQGSAMPTSSPAQVTIRDGTCAATWE
jgi:hypothetical protein